MVTQQRWQQIKKILDAVQDLSPAERANFLYRECRDDDAMYDEVESLLAEESGSEDFLSVPAYEFAEGMLFTKESEFAAGQKVGRYTILSTLGTGGMGQIYLAEDSQLNRKIALKLISPQFANDVRRVDRFEQEALAASALNHPNICVIYDLGTTERGRHFIAMEYIQGITLREKLARGPLTVRQALNIALQVADALSTTHGARIVHRDIKPENIMVRADGIVKVLDFGLAKLTKVFPQVEGVQDAPGTVHSEMGMLIGTVKYMSPEQLRDIRVDERTDIWSLGVVLYEMLTGGTPFEGKTSNDAIAAILDFQPAPLKFPRKIPSELQEILGRVLEKERDQRYQTVTKLATDLKLLRSRLLKRSDRALDLPSVSGDELQTWKIKQPGLLTRLKSQALLTTDFLLTEIRSHKKAALFTWVTGVLVGLLLIPTIVSFINSPRNSQPSLPEMTLLTNSGSAVCSAISRDGKWVVHAEELGGNQRLSLTNTASSTSVELVAAANVRYLGVTFTHDGNYIYFTRFENTRVNLYRLAIPGGASLVKIKEGLDSPISLSPQDDRFAFVRLDKNTVVSSLILSAIDGSNEQVLATRQNNGSFSLNGLAWSPDGNFIVCPVNSWNKGYMAAKLVAYDIQTNSARLVGNQEWFSILKVAWQDDMSSLIISARARPSSPVHLWRVNFPDGGVELITNDLSDYTDVSVSGAHIVSVRKDATWQLSVSSLDNSSKATEIVAGFGLTYGVSWAPSGKILFSSVTQNTLSILGIDPDGSNQIQVTSNGDNFAPVSSPDGKFIVFASNRNGTTNIWRMNADGSDSIQVTKGEFDFNPSISPDNRWVAYNNLVDSKASAWRVPLAGGDPVKIGERCRMPVYSPDSQFIACYDDLGLGYRNVAIFPAQGGEPLRHLDVPFQEEQQPIQWLANGRSLSYVKNVNGYSNIWSYNLETGTSNQLTNFTNYKIYAYAWSQDYKQIVLQRGISIANVIMIREKSRG